MTRRRQTPPPNPLPETGRGSKKWEAGEACPEGAAIAASLRFGLRDRCDLVEAWNSDLLPLLELQAQLFERGDLLRREHLQQLGPRCVASVGRRR